MTVVDPQIVSATRLMLALRGCKINRYDLEGRIRIALETILVKMEIAEVLADYVFPN